jgi:protein SCO1/2
VSGRARRSAATATACATATAAAAAAAAACALLALAAGAALAAGPEVPLVQRPVQGFVANPAGSYALPVIQPGADGLVLEGDRVPRRLSRYTHGAVTLLSFVYTYCTDPTGCPLAYATFDDLRQRVAARPRLKGQVRFVSLSFDPTNDTPDAMRLYGGDRARAGTAVPWHFLTTHSMRLLQPILDGFGQDVEVERDASGRPTRAITHMLKVFLLDREGMVREIYSSAFLHPEVMLNDIETLVLQARPRDRPGAADAP